jgi:SAM-dependent methyltransferase
VTRAGSDRYIIRGGIEGRERLRVLARAMHPTTAAVLERVGVAEGAHCLDVGSGGGDVSLELARRAGAGGQVVGLDLDEAKLTLAREEAAHAGVTNVKYRNADVMTTDLEVEFDLVYARFLLTHLADPAAAARKLFGSLRPGGVLVVEDIDVSGSFCHPDSEAYRYYLDVYTRTAEARGGHPNIGPRLPRILLQAGCEPVGVNVVQPAGLRPDGHDGDVKLVSPLTLENIADAAVAEGLATREELDRTIEELHRLASDDRTVMSLPRIVQAWGYRAGSAG